MNTMKSVLLSAAVSTVIAASVAILVTNSQHSTLPPPPPPIVTLANTAANELDLYAKLPDNGVAANDAVSAERELIAQAEVDKSLRATKVNAILPQVTQALNAKDPMAMNRAAAQLRAAVA